MKRRQLIAGLGGIAVSASRAAIAQTPEKVRRVGLLTGLGEGDWETKARLAAFRAGLAALGWVEGRNLRIDTRFAPGIDADAARLVDELLALGPDILVVQAPGVPAAVAATRTVPIVFVQGNDPVGAGWVESLARPGGMVTGLTSSEPGFGPKLLQLLVQIAPGTRRALVVEVISKAAPDIVASAGSLGIEVLAPALHSPQDIEAAITEFARVPQGGLVLPRDSYTAGHRQLILGLAMKYRLPHVSGSSPVARDGGLLFYGADTIDIYRRAADYVDRILKGARPADLPVQQPTKFSLIVNLRTARALGLAVPPLMLAEADEVID